MAESDSPRNEPDDEQGTPQEAEEERAPREADKEHVPAGNVPQRPGEEPIGNGGTNRPAAFPPHN